MDDVVIDSVTDSVDSGTPSPPAATARPWWA